MNNIYLGLRAIVIALNLCNNSLSISGDEFIESFIVSGIAEMYKTYHEAPEDKFVDTLTLIMENDSISKLQE